MYDGAGMLVFQESLDVCVGVSMSVLGSYSERMRECVNKKESFRGFLRLSEKIPQFIFESLFLKSSFQTFFSSAASKVKKKYFYSLNS